MAQQIADIDTGAAETAATLAKADLTTELVKEFTELQGIVGGLYARAQGHAEAVALAVYDHYKPLSIESEAARTREGALVAIADKADSIAGMFALGHVPSGSKDPFALRRAANGIVKTMAAHNLSLTLSSLMNAAFHTYDNTEAHARFRVSELDYERSVAEFFRERLEFYLRDALAFDYDVVNAVLAVDFQSVDDAVLRAEAVAEVKAGASAEFEAISLSFKRIKNILRQAAEKGAAVAAQFNASALREAQEQQLARDVESISSKVRLAREQRDYKSAVREIATVRPSLDLFFDKVMVMVDDADLRAQRLALLATIIAEFSTIADFSEIVASSS
jgi:glycyl-tRNA synthetase beta chain